MRWKVCVSQVAASLIPLGNCEENFEKRLCIGRAYAGYDGLPPGSSIAIQYMYTLGPLGAFFAKHTLAGLAIFALPIVSDTRR